MAYQGRFGRRNVQTKFVKCSCGSEAKLKSRKNYPFGQKSKVVRSRFYKCSSCEKLMFINRNEGGRR
jgi:hypothetical protein